MSIPDPRGNSQHSALLQLVRLDGQGLQTLYCFPGATYSGQNTSRLPLSLQWSVNEPSILFSVNTNNDTSLVQLLNVTSGALHTWTTTTRCTTTAWSPGSIVPTSISSNRAHRHPACIQTMRAVLPTTLLLLVQVYNATTHGFSHRVWSMSLPGGSIRTLTTLSASPGDQTGYTLNETSQFPWSNLARNGNAYALHTANPATSVQSILVGPLAGGPASSIATTNPGKSTVGVVGWTTL